MRKNVKRDIPNFPTHCNLQIFAKKEHMAKSLSLLLQNEGVLPKEGQLASMS